jgi:hypothetical protein
MAWRSTSFNVAGTNKHESKKPKGCKFREPRNFAQKEIGLLDWKKISTWEAPWSDELVSRS